MLRTHAVCFLMLTSLVGPALAETIEFDITVEAGKYDRQGVPVRAALPLAGPFAQATNVRLTNGDDAVPAQLTAPGLQAPAMSVPTRTLHFILPSLKAGATAVLRAVVSDAPAADSVKGYAWNEIPGEYAELSLEKPVLRYMYHKLDDSTPAAREQTYKPFHHVFSPDGSRIITKGPGGKFTHHRGLYFGFNRISYGPEFAQHCDVWHCKAPAYQEHEKFVQQEAGFVLGRHRVQIGWHGEKGVKFAHEQRELSVYNVPGGQFIEFASLLTTVAGPVRLDGDPQHSGFHFRADNEVAESTAKQTYYLRPDGKGGPGETRNWDAKGREPKAVDEPWKVMSFVLGDKRYSTLRIDHPDNPGEDRSSERDYGRFGGYFEYDLTEDKPLKLKYRVIVRDGEFTADEAQRLTADFVSPPKVTVAKVK